MNLYQMKLLHAIGKLRHSFIHTTRSIKSIVQSHLNFLTQLNSFHPENLMLLSFFIAHCLQFIDFNGFTPATNVFETNFTRRTRKPR